MSGFSELVREISDGNLSGASDSVVIAMGLIILLMIIISVIALVVAVMLAISYAVYNRKKNSSGRTGEQIARTILDSNGLSHIRVSKTGSIIFGNSYSHYFKKVRLRRLTWKKKSVTSLTMAAQKSCLAILDNEGDPSMKTRVALTPIIYLGPLAFVPMVIIGVLLDLFVFKSGNGTCVLILTLIALAFYCVSFVMSLVVLKTEKKAQVKALQMMRVTGIANAEEIEMSKKLFRLYNIEYVNNMIISLLELVYRVLQIVGNTQSNSSSERR